MNKQLQNLVNSIGYIYLGDWLIDKYNDKEMKDEIHSLADQELYNAIRNNRSVERIDNIVILSLILIALEEYDGSFWPHIEKYYPLIFPQDNSKMLRSEQWINNKLREKITYIYGETNSGSRIINHLLVQSFVPKKYLNGFFEFVHAILKYNYDFYLFDDDDKEAREEVEEELLELFNILFSNTQIDDVDKKLEITLDNSYKEYELITSTKMALGNKNISRSLLPLIIDILKILEAQYYNQDLTLSVKNEYLLSGLNEWNKKSGYKSERHNRSRSKASGEIIRPKILRFNVSPRTITLRSRRHNIANFKPGDNVRIVVSNNGIKVYENEVPPIKQVMGAYRIDPIEIELNSFLGQLEYKLFLNDNCYYASKDLLNSNYLFFDNQGNYLSDYKSYEGNIILTTNTKLVTEESFEEIEDGFVYFLSKTKDTILDFGSIKVTSEERLVNSVVGEETNIYATIDGEEIDVFKNVKSIRIEDKNIDKDILHLRINDINSKIPSSYLQSINNDDKFFYEIDLSFLELDSNYYEVEIIEGSKGKVDSFSFILDKDLETKEEVTSGISYSQKIGSSFFNEIDVVQEILDLKEEEIVVLTNKFEISHKSIEYLKPIKNDNYKIRDKFYYPNRLIWLPDVENEIEFNFAGMTKIKILTKENEFVQEEVFVENSNIYKIHKHHLRLLMEQHETPGLRLFISTRNEIFVIEILQENYLIRNKNKIFYTEGEYYLDLQFVGKNKLSIEIYQDQVQIDKLEVEKNEFVNLNLKQDMAMKILIVEGENNPFSMTKRRVLKELEFYHHSLKSLISKNYKLESVYSFESDRDYKVRNTYLKDLRIDGTEIKGTLFFVFQGYKISEFKKLNPVKINFIEESYDPNKSYDIKIHMVDSDEDGLILGDKTGNISYDGENVRNRDNVILVESVKLIVSEVIF